MYEFSLGQQAAHLQLDGYNLVNSSVNRAVNSLVKEVYIEANKKGKCFNLPLFFLALKRLATE
jgi:DNA-binding IclR family transcriptional regulator